MSPTFVTPKQRQLLRCITDRRVLGLDIPGTHEWHRYDGFIIGERGQPVRVELQFVCSRCGEMIVENHELEPPFNANLDRIAEITEPTTVVNPDTGNAA